MELINFNLGDQVSKQLPLNEAKIQQSITMLPYSVETPQSTVDRVEEANLLRVEYPQGVVLDDVPAVGTRSIYRYRQLVKAGYQVVFAVSDRPVYDVQIKKLANHMINNGMRHMYTQPVLVCPVQQILQNNPKFKVVDLYDHPITSETPGIEKYLLVLDGKHRITSIYLYKLEWFDCFVEIEGNCSDPLRYMQDVNSFDKNWTDYDVKHLEVKEGEVTNPLYTDAAKLADRFDLTQQVAQGYLRLSLDSSNDDPHEDNEANRLRGIKICAVVQYTFSYSKQGGNIQILEAIIQAYHKLNDQQHATFTEDICAFFLSLEYNDRVLLEENLMGKKYQEVKEYIVNNFLAFVAAKEAGKKKREMRDAMKQFKEIVDYLKLGQFGIKKLRFGTPAQMLRNAYEYEHQNSSNYALPGRAPFEIVDVKQQKANHTGSQSEREESSQKENLDNGNAVEDIPVHQPTKPKPYHAGVPVSDTKITEE